MSPLSSFSIDRATAEAFAGSARVMYHYVITGTVPASRILATARTGFGCLNEEEMVILRSEGELMMQKVET